MERMWLYGIVLAGFAVLFLLSRGGFRASAAFLKKRFFTGQPISEETLKKALLALFAANLLAAALSASYAFTDTVGEGYLLREERDGLDYEAVLRMETEEGSRRVGIVVEAQSYTLKEAEKILAEAETWAFAEALGENKEGRVTKDLHLPSVYERYPVSVAWVSGDLDLLEWDGRIGERVPPEGAEVELSVTLTFDGRVAEGTRDLADARPAEETRDLSDASLAEETRDLPNARSAEETQKLSDALLTRHASRMLRVFPKQVVLDEEGRIRAAIADENAPDSERVVLPEEIDGQAVRWARDGGDPGVTVLALGLVLGVGLLLNAIQKSGKAEKERQERLALDYPYVISRLTLCLGAGLSLRSAFGRMAADYENALSRGGERREGMEAIRKAAAEIRNGASETEAVRRLGEHAQNPRYRALSQLLLQHLSRGNRELALVLAEDSREAFEERKKVARIRGEQAGTKLVFPMLLMLGVVIVILMVPAVVNFF